MYLRHDNVLRDFDDMISTNLTLAIEGELGISMVKGSSIKSFSKAGGGDGVEVRGVLREMDGRTPGSFSNVHSKVILATGELL